TSGTSINADRSVLDSVHMGDGSVLSFARQSFNDLMNPNLNDNVRTNKYVNTHTYPGEGRYTIYLSDPTRNDGIVNITSSVNQPFSIQTDIAVFDPAIHCVNN